MNDSVNFRAYIFKYRFIWLGWIVQKNEPVTLYYDNTPTVTLEPEINIRHVTIGFTQKGVFNRLRKWILKEVGV